MNTIKLKRLALSLCIASSISNATAKDSSYKLITTSATKETKELYNRLVDIQGKAMLFGHHYSNVSGHKFTDWEQEQKRSDIYDCTKDYPAVFGFDFGRGFENQLTAVKEAAKMGGVITFSDHVRNPLAPKSYKHIPNLKFEEVKAVLPGGEHHKYLTDRLDEIAEFASQAVIDGHKIPIIYRPWHENTGKWFWWGSESATAEEFTALWRFTVEYLRDKKGVDNFIYAYSPSFNQGPDAYEAGEPGAEWYDIAGFDLYSSKNDNQPEVYIQAAKNMVSFAKKHHKLAAFTEFGYSGGIQKNKNPKWFTEEFLNPILSDEEARYVVYALTWSNKEGQRWIPVEGDITSDDFIKFYNNPFIAFLSNWIE